MPGKIVVVGGGAAGFFSAIHAANSSTGVEILILEKTSKLLQKVKISGGGRCNVTHHCFDNEKLLGQYPRGTELLKKAFAHFAVKDTIAWFEKQGLRLKTEADGRMFPISNRSDDVVHTLIKAAESKGIKIHTRHEVRSIKPTLPHTFEITCNDNQTFSANKVIVTVGGYNKLENYQWLSHLGHKIVEPAPSLFTFNIPQSPLAGLEGISVEPAKVYVKNTDFAYEGAVLITHWGLSGPAVLKASAFAARFLWEKNYQFECLIDWLPRLSKTEILQQLKQAAEQQPKKAFYNLQPFPLPARLWQRICQLSHIQPTQKAAETGKRHFNSLIDNLKNMSLSVSGKSTYKEEFVTSGGVSCHEVHAETMESLIVPGLYFAGEVLDIDGITGGFNFQAAWTTGYLAGTHAGLSTMLTQL